jgi:N utilization substance protein B
VLYAWEQSGAESTPLAVEAEVLINRKVAARYQGYLHTLIKHLDENLPEIDSTLKAHLSNWRLDRLAVIDRNILRIGTCELMHQRDVPSAVVMHEAIQLAQRYGSAESGRFVNGVLDAVAKAVRGPNAA